MRIICTLFFCLGVALASETNAQDYTQQDIEHGAYLAHLGDCAACHTTPKGRDYAGNFPLKSFLGTIYSTNITPDPDDGIGLYTLDDFSRALREGRARDGHYLYPAMPYTSFSGMSDEDIRALYIYFMYGVTPVHEPPQKITALSFPFNQRWGLAFWQALFLEHSRFQAHADHDPSWNRGAYIAETLGHCGACHTPRGPFYQEKAYHGSSSSYLAGGVIDNWLASNLRGDPAAGLGRWSEKDIISFLKTGHGAGTIAFGSMTQTVEDSTQHFTDDDAAALAHYLKSLPPVSEETTFQPDTAPSTIYQELPGAGLYHGACASCHEPLGQGDRDMPKLAGSSIVLEADPSSLIRIVLEGSQTPATLTNPHRDKMPSFARWTDAEIADVLTYIRRSWGNKAPAVTSREVMLIRDQVRKN